MISCSITGDAEFFCISFFLYRNLLYYLRNNQYLQEMKHFLYIKI